MRTLKQIWLPALSTLVIAGAACRDRDEQRSTYKPVETERTMQPVRTDDTVTQDRERATTEMRARLARLDDRISEMRARGDDKATDLANGLRVRRDQLAERLERASEQTSQAWDGFKQDVSTTFDDLERQLDDAF